MTDMAYVAIVFKVAAEDQDDLEPVLHAAIEAAEEAGIDVVQGDEACAAMRFLIHAHYSRHQAEAKRRARDQ